MTDADMFAATALRLSAYRRKTIARLTSDPLASGRSAQLALRREALRLRRVARGTKLVRRLRRKAQLGRLGSF